MPIEIRELVIKATLSHEPDSTGGAGTGATDREQIIAACVEHVLAILKEKAER
jgi:hypothetical protein